jgi:hypothetical protein
VRAGPILGHRITASAKGAKDRRDLAPGAVRLGKDDKASDTITFLLAHPNVGARGDWCQRL